MMYRNNSRSQYEGHEKVSGTDGGAENKESVEDWGLRNGSIEKKRGTDESRYRMVTDENSIYEYDLKCVNEKNSGL